MQEDDDGRLLIDVQRLQRLIRPLDPKFVRARDALARCERVWGAQIRLSRCCGVFVDESAEAVASVEVVRRVGADKA